MVPNRTFDERVANRAENVHANGTSPAEVSVNNVIERRKNDVDRRTAAEAREERNYVAARRRILALEKALDMIVGSVAAPGHQLDPARMSQFRQGIDVARALLGARPSDN
jgi:hypothetical protein